MSDASENKTIEELFVDISKGFDRLIKIVEEGPERMRKQEAKEKQKAIENCPFKIGQRIVLASTEFKQCRTAIVADIDYDVVDKYKLKLSFLLDNGQIIEVYNNHLAFNQNADLERVNRVNHG